VSDDRDLLCARLRGELVPITRAMVDEARRHRIHLVLADSLAHDGPADDALGRELRSELRTAAAVDLVRDRILRDLLARFAAAKVDAILFKGAALAYTVYSSPYLRQRADIDVLIARAALDRAERALADGGWLRAAEPDGELATSQRHYVLRAAAGVGDQLDLHWKIAIPQLFADALGFEELWSRSVPIAALAPQARTPSIPDALFLACVHRVAHHADDPDLLWLWDIHLLASRLADGDRSRFTGLAARASMRAICARGIELASARFHTPSAAELVGALEPETGGTEPSAAFLRGGLRPVDLLRSDLSTLHGWRPRLTLLAEHLFPSAGYMRSVYPRCPVAALPLAYVFRIVRGAPQWFRRGNSDAGAAR
jgi:hypothetical protein